MMDFYQIIIFSNFMVALNTLSININSMIKNSNS